MVYPGTGQFPLSNDVTAINLRDLTNRLVIP